MRPFLLLLVLYSGSLAAQSRSQQLARLDEVKRQGDRKEAARVLDGLEKQWPDDTAVLFERGLFQLTAEGDHNGALAAFSKALRIKPTMLRALMGRAFVFEEKGMYDKAITDYTAALAQAPRATDTRYARAGCFFKSGSVEQALADYRLVIEQAPAYPPGYVDAAGCLRALGRAGEADALFQKALAVKDADRLALQCAYGKFLLGEGRFAEAAQQYGAALRSGSDRLEGADYNNAAIAAYKSQDLPAAIRYSEKAMQLEPKNIDYKVNRASIAYDEPNWTRVLEVAREAIALAPASPEANMIMAVGLIKTGNESEGRRYQARARELAAQQKQ